MLESRFPIGGGLVLPKRTSKDICPNGCDLQGEPIPQEYIDKGYYGNSTHYSRLMGYDFPGIYDGVLIWACPDCELAWPRFTEGRLHDKAQEMIKSWNKEETK